MAFPSRDRSCFQLFAVSAWLQALSLTAAVGTLRLADSAGVAFDRGLVRDDRAYYLRFSNVFRADLGLQFSASELGASYGLRLTPDPLSLEVSPFHTGELRYVYATPRFVLSITETGGIGEQTFLGAARVSPISTLAPAPAPGFPAPSTPTLATSSAIDSSLLPGALTLSLISSRTAAAASYRWERRLGSVLSAGYQVYGGLGRDAQRYLALQHTVDGSISVDYGISARTSLVSALVAAHGWSSSDVRYTLFTLSESVQYKWSATTNADAGVGISSRASEVPDDATRIVTTPVAAVGVTHHLGGRDLSGSLRFQLTYAPVVDALTARIQNRLVALGSAGMTQGDLRAGVSLTASQAIPTDAPGAVSSVTAGAYGGYQLNSWLGATLHAQVTRQELQTTGLPAGSITPSGVVWGVYAGLYAVSPTWRF